MNLNYSTFPWLEERTILLSVSGSYAYGTNIDTSDRDYKGICIPPIDYYFGLKGFNEYNSSGGKNFRNTKDDVDITISHLVKFAQDAMKGVPNNIELLFMRDCDYVKLTDAGRKLIGARQLFLSKLIYPKFAGYARSQMEKLKKGYTSESEYDFKSFMHTIRLLTSAIEILETGDFRTYRPNRKELLDCRLGKYTFSEAVKLIELYDNQLKEVNATSKLRDTPDEEAINHLLIEIHEDIFMRDKNFNQ